MENAYDTMSDFELEILLANTQRRLDDKEDERSLLLEQSQSGQHISSKYIRSHCRRIEQEIEALKSAAEEIEREMENRKN
jgi:phosphopantetheine adenylyltransferase